MPVLSKCPLCRGVMPDTHGEARCPRCGELVLPAIRKLCAGCGTDVTRQKRVRDDAGEYYCHDCWDAKQAARGEAGGYACNTCGRTFRSDQVYQDGDEVVCRACYARRPAGVSPTATAMPAAAEGFGDASAQGFEPGVATAALAAAPRAGRRGRRGEPPWGVISIGLAVLAAAVLVLVVMAVS